MYTYNPAKIKENGIDRMRFELGDTLVDGGVATCVLADAEYEAVLSGKNRTWGHAKLCLLDAICMKLSYQVNYKVDVLSYNLGDRARLWKEMRDELKKQLSTGVPSVHGNQQGGHYFYAGMLNNDRTE